MGEGGEREREREREIFKRHVNYAHHVKGEGRGEERDFLNAISTVHTMSRAVSYTHLTLPTRRTV